MCVMLRNAIALAEVLRVASSPEAEYAVVTVNAARELAAARLKSDGYLEVREGAPGVMELRLTPLGLRCGPSCNAQDCWAAQALRTAPHSPESPDVFRAYFGVLACGLLHRLLQPRGVVL